MSKIPEVILQAGCSAYGAEFINGSGSLGDGIEAAYFAIHDHGDWVRPGPEAWTGEGLPPVGTELEVGFACEDFEIWHKGLCVAVGEDPEGRTDFCVVKVGKKIAMYTNEAKRMRPIRTAEQIAAEERKVAIWEMACDCGYGHNEDQGYEVSPIFAAAYDKGYRKQVQS